MRCTSRPKLQPLRRPIRRRCLKWGWPEANRLPASAALLPNGSTKETARSCAAREPLDIPEFALDGGEEPEIVGGYVINRLGVPTRLGFSLGNEWSDHATEKINYLYLAPSKLRSLAVGPELHTDWDFQEVSLRCTVTRGKQAIYDSGMLFSGEQHMSHSLANLEDHHFKYPQHRLPGDVHLHFFGTSKLSYSTRDWKFADGDVVKIEATGWSAPLTNPVSRPKGA